MSTLTIKINNVAYPIRLGSFNLGKKLDEQVSCSFTVRDTNGEYSFVKGQAVEVEDSVKGILFTGKIHARGRTKIPGQSLIWHNIKALDAQSYGNDRTSNKLYTNQYSGVIAADQASILAEEGITASYAMRMESSQEDFETGTLSNVAAVESGDGALELAPAGDVYEYEVSDFSGAEVAHNDTENSPSGLTLESFNAIALSARQNLPESGNTYLYVKIRGSLSFVIQSGDQLELYMWVDGESGRKAAMVDFVCSDGTTFRDAGIIDQVGLPAHPSQDLGDFAVNRWFRRIFLLTPLAGKTISYFSLSFEGNEPGPYRAWFTDIKILRSSSSVLDVFTRTSTSISTRQVIVAHGYLDVRCELVKAYEKTGYAESDNIAGSGIFNLYDVGIYRDSLVTWRETTPENCTVEISANHTGNPYFVLPCVRGGEIPSFIAGENMDVDEWATLTWRATLTNGGNDPTITPVLNTLLFKINPSYATTKSDYTYVASGATEWNAGTYSSTSLIDDRVSIPGYFRDWSTEDLTQLTIYSTGSGARGLDKGDIFLSVNSGTDVRLRIENQQFQNFIYENKIQCPPAGHNAGLCYRTTNWGNNNNSGGYYAVIGTAGPSLSRGNNSTGAGSNTAITSASVTLTAGEWYTLKVIANGSNHQIFINDIRYINFTDATYSGTGYLALRYFQNSGSRASCYFGNVGAVTALSGTWTSPAINVSSAGDDILGGAAFLGTIGQPGGEIDEMQASVLTEISLNNGSSYTTVTPGNISAPLTAGTDLSPTTQLKIRLTLAQTTTLTPTLSIEALYLHIISNYSASGSRISEPLDLSDAGVVGSTLTAWNADVPAGTSLTLATSQNGNDWTDITSSGDSIAGIAIQQGPVVDTFDADSSSDWTNTNKSGGSTATITYNTTDSRLELVGGTSALYLHDDIESADVDLSAVFWRSDFGGLAWRVVDTNNYYEIGIRDSDAPAAPSSVQVFRTTSGSTTTTGPSNVAIDFERDTPHVIRVKMVGTTITVYWDGEEIADFVDVGITSAGKVGLRNDTFSGGDTSYVQNVHFTGLGENLGAEYQYFDSFAEDTLLFYESTNSDGSNATWTVDTVNDRLQVTGGDNAVLFHYLLRRQDIDLQVTMSRTDVSGLAWRGSEDGEDFYCLIVNDASSSNSPNVAALFRIESGAFNYIDERPISFTRNTEHDVRITMIGGTITVYFDGAELFEYVDGTPLTGGRLGLWTDGGTGYFTDLRIAMPRQVYVRATLTSSDPLYTPQLQDLTIAALSPDIDKGSLVEMADYQYTYVSDNMADLLNKSPDNYYLIRANKSFVFGRRKAQPAPWVLWSLDRQFLLSGFGIDDNADLYRNREIIKNCYEPVAFSATKVGDGSSTSWTLGYPLDSEPVISLNGQQQTVGVKGQTGYAFYWERGSAEIVQDSTGTKLQEQLDVLEISGFWQKSTTVVRNNTGQFAGTISQSDYAAITGGSGIVERITDGGGISKDAAEELADSLLQRNGVIGQTISFMSRRWGVEPGQYFNTFVSAVGLHDNNTLISSVDITASAIADENGDSDVMYKSSVKCIEGPNTGSFGKLFAQVLKKMS